MEKVRVGPRLGDQVTKDQHQNCGFCQKYIHQEMTHSKTHFWLANPMCYNWEIKALEWYGTRCEWGFISPLANVQVYENKCISFEETLIQGTYITIIDHFCTQMGTHLIQPRIFSYLLFVQIRTIEALK